jgi:hypothetical protein
MSEYLLYMINDLGHVRGRFVLRCGSDLGAIALVERRRSGQHVELWQGERLIRAFEPDRQLVDA